MEVDSIMLPKANRLKKKKDFDMIFKRGRGVKKGPLFFKCLPSGSKQSRFGFIVSQHVSKKAVVRNRLKRRLRELVRQQLGSISKPVDCLIVAQPGAEKLDFRELDRLIRGFFKYL